MFRRVSGPEGCEDSSALRHPFSPPISNGPLAAHGPPPLRESGSRMSCIYGGSRLCSTDRRHKRPRASQGHPLSDTASRNLSSYHGQTVAQPIQRASLPAVPRPSGLPAGTEKPAPQGDLGMRARKAGAGSCLPYFAAAWRRATLALMHSTTPTARTPTIAVTQAADESKGVSQPYPYLRPGPLRIHKAVLLRPRLQGSAQCQARFPVIRHRNRPIPQTPAAAIAPFVHWDIRAQTAGIYLPIH